MSRRRRGAEQSRREAAGRAAGGRQADGRQADERQAGERQADEPPGSARPAPRPGFPARFLTHAAILMAVFAIVSAIAELAGAANLGVALGIGTIAFAIALVAVIVTD